MSTENEVVAWGMVRPDGLVLGGICPDEHAAYGGSYTVPLFPQSSIDQRDARIRELEAQIEEMNQPPTGTAPCARFCEHQAFKIQHRNDTARIAELEAQLLAQAPARQPLTDEQALAIVKAAPALDSAEQEWLHVIRAVERAHGITGDSHG